MVAFNKHTQQLKQLSHDDYNKGSYVLNRNTGDNNKQINVE
jgi:hypothetical protein